MKTFGQLQEEKNVSTRLHARDSYALKCYFHFQVSSLGTVDLWHQVWAAHMGSDLLLTLSETMMTTSQYKLKQYTLLLFLWKQNDHLQSWHVRVLLLTFKLFLSFSAIQSKTLFVHSCPVLSIRFDLKLFFNILLQQEQLYIVSLTNGVAGILSSVHNIHSNDRDQTVCIQRL